jgi:gluconolactonase
MAFPWSAGGLGEPDVYCTLDGAYPDGMCFDAEGTLYVAGTLSGEVQAFDPDGQLIERYQAGPGAFLTNCCFGGADGSTLYATDAATMLDPPHDERHRQRIVAFPIGTPGLPLFTGD